MQALLLYLLKANAVLVLFAAAYYGLLRRLTFFGLNRAYLLLALGFAAVYPALPVPALLPAALVPELVISTATGTGGPASAPEVAAPFDWWLLAGSVYAAGTALLLLRLLAQLLSLARLHGRARPTQVLGQAVRVVPGTGGPFSFAGSIYLTASTLDDARSLAAALRHEQAHVRQWHTLDVLLLQVAAALAWVNPAVWLLRRAALDNLEYLADQAALHTGGLVRRDYQYLLLRQQTGGVPAPALAFQFSFLTLKNRIAMLNQPVSTTRQLGRYLLAAPLVMLLALGYSSARAQATNTFMVQLMGPNGPSAPFQVTAPATLDHFAFYVDAKPSTAAAANALDPQTIASMDITKDKAIMQQYTTDPTATGVAFITTKANADAPAVLALADKADLNSSYVYTPREVNAVLPKSLAYITSHYPDARLSGEVTEMKKKSTGAVKLRVQLAQGRRPFYIFFSPEGNFLAEARP